MAVSSINTSEMSTFPEYEKEHLLGDEGVGDGLSFSPFSPITET